MPHRSKLFFLLLMVLWIPVERGLAKGADDYYKRGMRAAENGHPKKALNIWLQAKEALQVPSTRIGVAYIRLATSQNLDDYYEYANLMYQWGFSASKVAPNKQVLDEEIERMILLAAPYTYKQWRRLWKNNDPQLYKALLDFWKRIDPTPTTVYNERLIEHWKRIAYSRVHYTSNKSGALKADDRAKIYVRYGPPDIISSGRLTFESGFAESYIYAIAETPIGCQVSSDEVDNKLQQARNYFTYPKYETWIYRKNPKRDKKNIYLFGSEAGSGNFEQVISVEDFIPQLAFNMGQLAVSGDGLQGSKNSCVANIRPGLVLQIIYYNQISAADPFYGDMFETITSRAVSTAGPVSLSLAFEMSGLAYNIIENQHLDAPRQASTEVKKMMDIPMQIYQYRLLNEKNQPYVATFVESRPQKAFLLDYLSNYNKKREKLTAKKLRTDNQFNHYQFIHALQVYNAEDKLQAQVKDSPTIVTQKGRAAFSLFTVPYVGKKSREVFTAKLENADEHSHYIVDSTLFAQNVRGIGTTEVTQPAPLNNDTGKLQMGDLIVGYNYSGQSRAESYFPFTVANDKEIPVNEELVVHIEIYHLQKNSAGVYAGTLSYQLRPDRNFLGWLKKHKSVSKLTLNVESNSPRYINDIQVKTKKLEPGTYTMHLVAGDSERDQKVEREFKFKVVKRK